MSDERTVTVNVTAPYSRFHERTGTCVLITTPLGYRRLNRRLDRRNNWVTFADGTGALFAAHELVVQP